MSHFMPHFDTIKTKIQPILGTEKILKFIYWILSDPKYGSINYINDSDSEKIAKTAIDLYKEWIYTGIKPNKKLWMKVKEATASSRINDTINTIYAASMYGIDSNAYNAAYIATAAATVTVAATDSRILRSDIEKVQIKYLENFINEELYTLEDYED